MPCGAGSRRRPSTLSPPEDIVTDRPCRYSGRVFTTADLDHIRKVIADHPSISRAALSRRVCEDLGWRRPDGRLKDMRCRVVLLRMQEDGILALPPASRSWTPSRQAPVLDPDTEPGPPIEGPIDDLLPLSIDIVSRKNLRLSHRHNTFLHRYHYLGYQPTPGANIRYAVYDRRGRELAFLSWGAAAWRTAPRDRWIGWNESQRAQRLHLIVNNTRFLILPWVTCPNLASHILGRIARRLPADWTLLYGYRPVLAETFVDALRYTGHCYRAANWTKLGQTTGRTKWNKTTTPIANKKDVWIYPLIGKPKDALLTMNH